MLIGIGKQSGESMESVVKKKRKATVGRICRKLSCCRFTSVHSALEAAIMPCISLLLTLTLTGFFLGKNHNFTKFPPSLPFFIFSFPSFSLPSLFPFSFPPLFYPFTSFFPAPLLLALSFLAPTFLFTSLFHFLSFPRNPTRTFGRALLASPAGSEA